MMTNDRCTQLAPGAKVLCVGTRTTTNHNMWCDELVVAANVDVAVAERVSIAKFIAVAENSLAREDKAVL